MHGGLPVSVCALDENVWETCQYQTIYVTISPNLQQQV